MNNFISDENVINEQRHVLLLDNRGEFAPKVGDDQKKVVIIFRDMQFKEVRHAFESPYSYEEWRALRVIAEKVIALENEYKKQRKRSY